MCMRVALRYHLINIHRNALRHAELLAIEVCKERCLREVKESEKCHECVKQCLEEVMSGEL